TRAPGAMRVHHQVPRDREQPRPHGTSHQRLRVLPGAQQRLLHDVLGLAPVPTGQPQDIAEERTSVLAVQGAQQTLIRGGTHTSDTYAPPGRFTSDGSFL